MGDGVEGFDIPKGSVQDDIPDLFEREFGTETRCPSNPTGHRPNWEGVSVDFDGDTAYLDVPCRYCGRSGCVGTVRALADNIDW